MTNDTTLDLLQIKIDQAKAQLSPETIQAIDAVPWKLTILAMRTDKGYSFSQLEDLEIETELLLCGLVSPEEYPNELEKRMGISKAGIGVLVNEMNEKVFKKIHEEFIKILERKSGGKKEETQEKLDTESSSRLSVTPDEILENLESREELLGKIENPTPIKPITNYESRIKKEEEKEKPQPMLAQKFSKSFQIPLVKTDHSLVNVSKSGSEEKTKIPGVDPYREIPQ